MRIKDSYPFRFSFIENRRDEAETFLKKKKPHKGGFLGLEVLEGTFPDGNAEDLFHKLSLGEKFFITRDESVKTVIPLEAKREDGVVIGYLPFSTSVILSSLIERGIKCFCFLEAKDENSGMYSVAVSVYCEEY